VEGAYLLTAGGKVPIHANLRVDLEKLKSEAGEICEQHEATCRWSQLQEEGDGAAFSLSLRSTFIGSSDEANSLRDRLRDKFLEAFRDIPHAFVDADVAYNPLAFLDGARRLPSLEAGNQEIVTDAPDCFR
jgi:hypothetical protein